MVKTINVNCEQDLYDTETSMRFVMIMTNVHAALRLRLSFDAPNQSKWALVVA